MQSTPSPRRASFLNFFLWIVPALCSLFFATTLLLARHAVDAPKPSIPAKVAPATISVPGASISGTPSALTPQQIDEILAAMPKFSDRSVWDRRATLVSWDRRNKNLFAQLGLGPEKAAELRALLIDQENARSRMHIAFSKAGLSMMDTLSATQEIMQRFDQKVEQCLGAENYKVFAHRAQNPGNYSILDDVVSILSVTERPLPDDKKHELYAAVLKTKNAEAFVTAIYEALPPEQSHVLLETIEAQTISDELSHMRMAIYRRKQVSTPNQ